MSLVTLLLVSVGLAADAFAVSVGKGLQTRRLTPRYALALAVTFGLFQGVMPVIGWLLGSGLRDYVTAVDHWIAFGLLALIGAKMIWEALAGDGDDAGDDGTIPLRELLVLGVATSIDALAVGIGFAFLEVSIVGAAVLIAAITFVLSYVGVYLGHRAGARFSGPAEVVGGVILIGIGTKILFDHLGVW